MLTVSYKFLKDSITVSMFIIHTFLNISKNLNSFEAFPMFKDIAQILCKKYDPQKCENKAIYADDFFIKINSFLSFIFPILELLKLWRSDSSGSLLNSCYKKRCGFTLLGCLWLLLCRSCLRWTSQASLWT